MTGPGRERDAAGRSASDARLDGSALALLGLALAAAAVSAYLTIVHYAEVPLVCTGGGVVDCQAVTQSSYSTVPGTAIPVTVPGLAWCALSAALALLALVDGLRGAGERAWLRPAQALWALAGMIPVAYLVYAEAVPLRRLCEWCTFIHIAVFASLLLGLQRLRAVAAPPLHKVQAARADQAIRTGDAATRSGGTAA